MRPPNPHPTHIEAVADAAASGFKGDVVTAERKASEDLLRSELIEYIELLEDLIANDEGIDGDAVPRELREILATSENKKVAL